MVGLSPRAGRVAAPVVQASIALAAILALAPAAGIRASSLPATVAPAGYTAIWDDFHYLYSLAYASSRGQLYASNEFGKVSVINTTTNSVVGEFAPFVQPYSVLYDPDADELFVADMGSTITYGSFNLSIIDLGAGRTVGTIPGTNPWGMVYDPVGHTVYVESNGTILVLDARTNAVVRRIPNFNDFRPQAYDASRHLLFGVNGTDTLAINMTNDTVVWSISNSPTGMYPIGFDPLNGDVYLAGLHSGRMSVDVVDGATGGTVATIPEVWNVEAFLFNPANGDMYISSNSAYWELVVVNATLNVEVARIELGAPPYGLAFDPADRDVYVACSYPTGNWTGVILVIPSGNYPLPNPWPGLLTTLGELSIVGAVIATVAILASRRRARAGAQTTRPPHGPPRDPPGPK